jgi:hypothetical protein
VSSQTKRARPPPLNAHIQVEVSDLYIANFFDEKTPFLYYMY